MITVLIADAQPVVRRGIHAVLSDEPDMTVVGETDDGRAVLELAARLQPGVVVADMLLPRLNGPDVIQQVSRLPSTPAVVIFSAQKSEAYVLQALRCGAKGYVLKDAPISDLLQALRAAIAGRHFLSAPLLDRIVMAYTQQAHLQIADVYETLTAREREVLQLAAEGLSNAAIAANLSTSPRTTETHRANLMRKLTLHSQTDLVRYALRRGLIPLD
jgi:DNA-binding NarL/FixJ family response regulator